MGTIVSTLTLVVCSALALAGCGSEHEPTSRGSSLAPNPSTSPGPSVPVPSSEPTPDPCVELTRDIVQLLDDQEARLLQLTARAGEDIVPEWRRATDILRTCQPDVTGVWYFQPRHEESRIAGSDNGIEYTTVAVLTRRQGDASTPVAEAWVSRSVVGGSGVAVRMVDYDGDGTLELILSSDGSTEGGGPSEAEVRVFTVDDDVVLPYGALARWELASVVDADSDGRPDFEIVGPFRGMDPWDCGGRPFGAPPMLLHSRADGSFRMDSPVALARLVERCSSAADPTVTVIRDGSPVDVQESLACARLRGESTNVLVARVREAIEATSDPDDGCETPRQAYLRFAAVEPPVRIDR